LYFGPDIAEQQLSRAVSMGCGTSSQHSIELLCTSPAEFRFTVPELTVVLDVLRICAVKYELPERFANMLQMEFAEANLEHQQTMKEAGLCDQAQFSVQGVEEAKVALAKETCLCHFWETSALVSNQKRWHVVLA
jgi:hypothetical protein